MEVYRYYNLSVSFKIYPVQRTVTQQTQITVPRTFCPFQMTLRFVWQHAMTSIWQRLCNRI